MARERERYAAATDTGAMAVVACDDDRTTALALVPAGASGDGSDGIACSPRVHAVLERAKELSPAEQKELLQALSAHFSATCSGVQS